MSDTQDVHELRKLIRALVVEYSTAYLSHEGAQKIIELCRAHFQRQAEPVAESTKTNLIDESGGYWIDGEFRIEGKDLDAMLDRLYTSPPIQPDMVMVQRELLSAFVTEEGPDQNELNRLRELLAAQPIPAEQWLPIETAPKDGTLVLLLLAHDNDFDNGIEAEEEHQPRTIGHNNFEHDGIDRWQFAGWNWEQDCYTEGWGTPIAWMPLPAAPAPKEGA